MQTYSMCLSATTKKTRMGLGGVAARLERADLRVCIDERDFLIGLPRLVNIERAVDASRHTLIVLTPNWISGEWNEFESLLAGSADPGGRRRVSFH